MTKEQEYISYIKITISSKTKLKMMEHDRIIEQLEEKLDKLGYYVCMFLIEGDGKKK